jgi:SAM-dependent methyltransferase
MTAVPCPLCDAPSTAAFTTTDRNRAIGDRAFHYRRCSGCRSYFLVDVPGDLGAYYPRDYLSQPTLAELREEGRREAWRMQIVARHASGGRLVEIGPGNGIFAVQAVEAGFETAVVERDAGACAHLRDTLGIEAVRSDAPEHALAAMAPSRAIVLWHVLEHVAHPWALVDAAGANLEPGGVLVVATPNPRALGLRLLGRRWPHVDAPRHLFLLDHEALAGRARSAGMELVQLTTNDPGGLHWNAFAWHFLLRRPGVAPLADGFAYLGGRAIARVLAPLERRGLRGAAYTAVLRRR